MEWSRVAIRKEPPIRTATRATEARHDGIESDLAGTAAVGGPDPPVLHSGKRACALAGRRWMRYS